MAKYEFLLRGLEPNQTYVVQVRSVNGDQYSAWSPKYEFLTDLDIVAPNAPSNLSVVVSGPDFVGAWDAPSLNEDGSPVEDLKDYQVSVYPTALPAQVRTYYVVGTRFDFTYAMNLAAFGTPQKDITFSVKSRDMAGNLSATAVTDSAVNGPPGSFTLDAVGEHQAIVLNWTKPSGDDLKEFEVYRNAIKIATVSGSTFTYNDADPGRGTHSYHIVAKDLFDQTSTSNSDSATASGYWQEDLVGPNPPTAVSFTSGVDTNDGTGASAFVEVTWTGPTTNTDASSYDDYEGFRVRWSRSVTGPYNYADIVDDGTRTADYFKFRIDALQTGVDYYIGVAAFDRYQNYSSYASDADGKVTTATDTTPPAIPTNLTLTGGIGTISADWSPNSEADFSHYEVYASTTSGFTPGPGNLQFSGNGTATSWPATAGQTWYAVVRALDKTGNASGYTAEQSATALGSGGGDGTPPAKATSISLTASTYFIGQTLLGKIEATWTPPADSDLAGYNIKLREDGQTDAVILTTIDDSQSKYIFTGLATGRTYWFSIQSIDTSDNVSGYTTEQSVAVSGSNAPAAPTMLTPETEPGAITFKWTEVTDEDLYDYKLVITRVIG